MSEADNLVLNLLREIRSEVADVKLSQKHMATNVQVASVREDLAATEKRLGERISHLNRAVMEYH